MNRERLLNVAKALRESPNPNQFTMDTYTRCGSPACALGHYAARPDLQDTFKLIEGMSGLYLNEDEKLGSAAYNSIAICKHFDITKEEATELFADGEEDADGEEIIPVGCGNPASAIAAAEFIERFVAQRGAT